jgi:hypothetical protein
VKVASCSRGWPARPPRKHPISFLALHVEKAQHCQIPPKLPSKTTEKCETRSKPLVLGGFRGSLKTPQN